MKGKYNRKGKMPTQESLFGKPPVLNENVDPFAGKGSHAEMDPFGNLMPKDKAHSKKMKY